MAGVREKERATRGARLTASDCRPGRLPPVAGRAATPSPPLLHRGPPTALHTTGTRLPNIDVFCQEGSWGMRGSCALRHASRQLGSLRARPPPSRRKQATTAEMR